MFINANHTEYYTQHSSISLYQHTSHFLYAHQEMIRTYTPQQSNSEEKYSSSCDTFSAAAAQEAEADDLSWRPACTTEHRTEPIWEKHQREKYREQLMRKH